MIPSLTLCSLDRFRGMVDVYNYIIRVVNTLTLIYIINAMMMILHRACHILRYSNNGTMVCTEKVTLHLPN